MKIIVTENQYNFLLEQKKEFDPMTGPGTFYGTYGYDKKGETPWTNLDPHTKLMVGQILTAFIPVAGPFISAGLGMVDAGLYYSEGKKGTAGITAVLSLLPFVGRIPGVKEVSSKVWINIASKIKSNAKLALSEIELLNQIAKYSDNVINAIVGSSKKLSPFAKQIQKYKPDYIERYGQESYEKLVKDFMNGVKDREYFIQTLRSSKKGSPQLTNFITKYGIKFDPSEISQLQKVAGEMAGGQSYQKLLRVTLKTKNGPKTIDIHTVSKEWVEKNHPRQTNAFMWAQAENDSMFAVKENIEKLTTKNIEDVLVHEAVHIKDPSILLSPAYRKKYFNEVLRGLDDWKMAPKAMEQGFGDLYKKYVESGVRNYYLNPWEVNANNSMVLQQFSTNTKNLQNVMPKKRILSALDNIINYTKGNGPHWGADASKLMGYWDNNIYTHFDYLSRRPSEYRKFLTKLAQQASYLKSQVKIGLD